MASPIPRGDRQATLIVVALGGIAGASTRWALDELYNARSWWPWAIFVANIAGAFVLGLVLAAPPRTSRLATALGTGFCGSLTTLSSLSVQVATWLDSGDLGRAAGYLAATVTVGMAAAAAGLRFGMARRRAR